MSLVYFYVFAVLVSYKLANSESPPRTPDTRCPVDSGTVADRSNVRRYLVCRDGRVHQTYTCFRGMSYRPEVRRCDVDSPRRTGGRVARKNEIPSCYLTYVRVTLHIQNDVTPPHFSITTDLHAPRMPLRFMLMVGAGKLPNFRYNTTVVEPYGEFVTSVNDVMGDFLNKTLWMIWSRGATIEPPDISSIFPSDGDHILLRYQSYEQL